MRYIILLGILFASTPAMADSRQAVATIGPLIAAERFCGLHYNADVLTVWVDDRVHPSDRTFFSMLDATITRNEQVQYAMNGATKQAHCQAAFDAAHRYGFLQDNGRSSKVAHATARSPYR